jgi:large subunit ribosomal protein L25
MANAELNVILREKAGKGVGRKLRAQGFIPAVVYGKNLESCKISVEPRALEQAVSSASGWNTLITLKGVPAVDGKVVVLKDLSIDAIRRTMISADFHALDLTHKGSFMVPIVTVGTSVGQKTGGLLQLLRHEIEVVCLPNAVPQSIEIDVTKLEIGDVVHVAELLAPAGVEIPHDVNFTVLTVSAPQLAAEELDGEVEEDETEGDEE